MGNGFSDKEMIEMILVGQRELKEDIRSLTVKVDQVALNGCAHRGDDLQRIESLESWKNRGIAGLIGAMFLSISSLFAILFSRIR